jgi:hypothetical protein
VNFSWSAMSGDSRRRTATTHLRPITFMGFRTSEVQILSARPDRKRPHGAAPGGHFFDHLNITKVVVTDLSVIFANQSMEDVTHDSTVSLQSPQYPSWEFNGLRDEDFNENRKSLFATHLDTSGRP